LAIVLAEDVEYVNPEREHLPGNVFRAVFIVEWEPDSECVEAWRELCPIYAQQQQ
jgi:hypothetical protein